MKVHSPEDESFLPISAIASSIISLTGDNNYFIMPGGTGGEKVKTESKHQHVWREKAEQDTRYPGVVVECQNEGCDLGQVYLDAESSKTFKKLRAEQIEPLLLTPSSKPPDGYDHVERFLTKSFGGEIPNPLSDDPYETKLVPPKHIRDKMSNARIAAFWESFTALYQSYWAGKMAEKWMDELKQKLADDAQRPDYDPQAVLDEATAQKFDKLDALIRKRFGKSLEEFHYETGSPKGLPQMIAVRPRKRRQKKRVDDT